MHSLATTVIIPVKNGGRRLDECLRAVGSQRTHFPFEVLCIDSGSTDDSVSVIERHGCQLYEIPPEDFAHGRTRNLGVGLAQTPFVALITQDAVPADENWLEELITPFRWDDTLAGVFGKHLPHEDCRESEAMMLERHFAAFGAENTTFRIGHNPRSWAEYSRARDFYVFFSDNNAALRKAVWEQIPYPDVEFMEDQLWAAAILEAGFGKGWAPRAAVRHSHNYDVLNTLQRAFDEGRFRRQYQDPTHSWTLTKWLEHATHVAQRDLRRLRVAKPKKWLTRAPGIVARTHADAIGRFLGDKSPFLPRAFVTRLSQHLGIKGSDAERRNQSLVDDMRVYLQGTFGAHGKIDGAAAITHDLVHILRSNNLSEALLAWRRSLNRGGQNGHWWESETFKSMSKPAGKLLKSRAGIHGQELVLNWVVPPYGKGGGGHQTIFRMIHLLEKRGVMNRVYVLDAERSMPFPSARLRSLVHEWFAPIEAPVEPLQQTMLPADFAIATHWSTAYPVRAIGNAVSLAYFVQDYEPAFYPAGAEATFAEETYRFGMFGITAGHWLAKMMSEKYGMVTAPFQLAVDHDAYWPEPTIRKGRSVFAYVRPHTPRRGFELMCLALREVKRQRPDVDIYTAGAELHPSLLPFPFQNNGILDHAGLRHQYSNATVGVCLSMSNYSLLPQEMAASGCPVIDVDGENTRAAYPRGAVVLAPPTVQGLTTRILEMLDNDVARRQQVQRGLEYANTLTWENSAAAVFEALTRWRFEREKPAGERSRRVRR
ncbi:MAG: glycosyltransferase [Myxococcota bacterium]